MLVLNIEPLDFSPHAVAHIEEFATYRAMPCHANPQVLEAEIAKADVLWIRLGQRLDTAFLEKASKLKIIVSPTTGLNHIDLEACSARAIDVLSLKGETEFLSSITSTAELTFGLLLESMRHMGRAHTDVVERGAWNRDSFRGRQIANKTIGIIGMGRLGRIVAEYALAFRMRVLFFDPHVDAQAPNGAVRCDIKDLLKAADIISLHANYHADNENMIGEEEFSTMKKGAYFINTARGELVDEDALLRALESGYLVGAALDVLASENAVMDMLGDHPLVRYAKKHDNLIITPHIGGASWDAMEATEIFMVGKLRQSVERMVK